MYALATKPTRKKPTSQRAFGIPLVKQNVVYRKKSENGDDILTKLIQPKVKVGPEGDRFEKEADFMAEKVTRSPTPTIQKSSFQQNNSPSLQRKKIDNDSSSSPSFESELAGSQNSGTPLSKDVRAKMEPHFGADFSHVRIHNNNKAARMSHSIGAYAFTYKNHIYFNRGQFNPHSISGTKLLAHELTHVVQQDSALYAKRRGQHTDSIQRLSFGLGKKLNKYAGHIPGWDMFTLIIGYNPLIGKPVSRTAKNMLKAFMGMVPGGHFIFQKLDELGVIDKASTIIDQSIKKLNISRDTITQILKDVWSAYSIIEGNLIQVLEDKFTGLYTRVVSLAKSAGSRLVALIKSFLVNELTLFLRSLPGYTLLTQILKNDPITQKRVPRSATQFVGGLLEFVPGGKQKFENLKKSGNISKAVNWLSKRIKNLGISLPQIVLLFKKAWNSFSIQDLLSPVQAFKKIAGIFSPVIGKLGSFAKSVVYKILQYIFVGLLGPTAERIIAIFKKGKKTYQIIVQDPIKFAGFLLQSVKKGFDQFDQNILIHLKKGVVNWILGNLAKTGLVLPEKWDLKGVIGLILQVTGISYALIRQKVSKVIGEKNVQRLEASFDLFKLLITEGPVAIWEKFREHVGNIKDRIVEGIKEWAITAIIKAALKNIAIMLIPVGAFIQAVKAIYTVITFFIDKINQIVALVGSIIDSIALIAVGKINTAADFIEKSMSQTIPMILGFLARLAGLDGISKNIVGIIKKIQKKVDSILDTIIAWIAKKGRAFLSKAKGVVRNLIAWWKLSKKFMAVDGKSHQIFFEGSESASQLMIASKKSSFAEFISKIDVGNNNNLMQSKLGAVNIANKIDGIKAEKLPDGNKQVKEAARNEKSIRIEQQLNLLRDVTIPLFGNIKPSSEPDYNPGDLFALKTRIDRLSIIEPPINKKGTLPTTAKHQYYDILDSRRTGTKGASFYIRGHLLNHNLHGHGEWYNMTPLSRTGNSNHEKQVESKVKNAVDSGATVEYEVTPEYANRSDKKGLIEDILDNDVPSEAREKIKIVEMEDFVPHYLLCKVKTVEDSKTKWNLGSIKVDNPIKRFYSEYQLSSSPAKIIINMNSEQNTKKLTNIPGVGEARASAIINYREFQKQQGVSKVFEKISDIEKVPSLGPKVIRAINKNVSEGKLTLNFD